MTTAKKLLEKSELLKGLMQGTFALVVVRRMERWWIDVQDDTGPIPLNNVAMNVLKKVFPSSVLALLCYVSGDRRWRQVLEWAEHHKDDPVEEKEDDARNKKSTDIDEWDQKFMQVDQEMLFEIILVTTLPAHITHTCPSTED